MKFMYLGCTNLKTSRRSTSSGSAPSLSRGSWSSTMPCNLPGFEFAHRALPSIKTLHWLSSTDMDWTPSCPDWWETRSEEKDRSKSCQAFVPFHRRPRAVSEWLSSIRNSPGDLSPSPEAGKLYPRIVGLVAKWVAGVRLPYYHCWWLSRPTTCISESQWVPKLPTDDSRIRHTSGIIAIKPFLL